MASYWYERRGGLIRPSLPGHAMASSLISLGLAVGGRQTEAEPMAEMAMYRGRNVCGGLATWAQAHIFDAGGRVSEGISALSNFDGKVNYEGTGLLFFDCRLGGYGARFSLDREERGRGKSAALRLYEANFDRVLEYSGFATGQPWRKPLKRSPIAWVRPQPVDRPQRLTSGILQRWLGLGDSSSKKKEDQDDNESFEIVTLQDSTPSLHLDDSWVPSCEDVLTWLPPTPALVSDATLLLLRFTLNGTISPRNARWDKVRSAWRVLLDMHKEYGDDDPRRSTLAYFPLGCATASILFPPSETGADQCNFDRLAHGLHQMGKLLQLGDATLESEKTTAIRELIAERSPDFWLPVDGENNKDVQKEWRQVVIDLASAVDGGVLPDEDEEATQASSALCIPTHESKASFRFSAWDFEARPLLEHAICYAACKAGDVDSLSLARSICSMGVTLRPVSPEEWWRYSIVLGLLGDQVGSEDALQTSILTGGGQGARGS